MPSKLNKQEKMKQILITILLGTAACLMAHAQPKATFDKNTHEHGVVLWKHPATATFTVKNESIIFLKA